MVDSQRDQLGRARQFAQALATQEPQLAHRIRLVPDLVVVGKLTLSTGLPACAAISRPRNACITHIRSCTLVMQWHLSTRQMLARTVSVRSLRSLCRWRRAALARKALWGATVLDGGTSRCSVRRRSLRGERDVAIRMTSHDGDATTPCRCRPVGNACAHLPARCAL